jgi:hypothetical protein
MQCQAGRPNGHPSSRLVGANDDTLVARRTVEALVALG